MRAVPPRYAGLRVVATLAVFILLLTGCDALGPSRNLTIQTGTISSAEGAISLETGDWTYAVPLEGVMWIDRFGTYHSSGRPDCLGPDATGQVRFAAVEVTVEGQTWRPVVWVSCL